MSGVDRAQLPPAPKMPYRQDLKRPDLKGTFPCSVCGKIFCHSSSLSRHRMQAHFKSYTCTLCNQEISSNETLRSHMFRAHEISRMFMCRCCNWAFPDKTSLHIHMQSMMRNGQPGEVNILAKSSSDDGSPTPITTSPNTSTPLGFDISPSVMSKSPSLVPMQPSGIFPSMPSREELLTRLRDRVGPSKDLPPPSGLTSPNAFTQLSPQNLLASWLANNFTQMATLPIAGRNVPGAEDGSCSLDGATIKEEQIADDDGIEIKMDEDESFVDEEEQKGAGEEQMVPKVEPTDSGMLESEHLPILRSAIMANPLNSLMYRKKLNNALRNRTPATEPNLANFMTYSCPQVNGVREDTSSPNRSTPLLLTNQESQASPAASDSQTSSTGAPHSAGSDGSSPQKCFECQVVKGKLGLAENRNRFLESKVQNLENKVARLESRIAGLEANSRRYEGEQKVMRDQCEVLERKLLSCQEKALRYLQENNGDLTNIKQFLDDLLQTTYLDFPDDH